MADEDRLLTKGELDQCWETIKELTKDTVVMGLQERWISVSRAIKAQDTKTVSILKAQFAKEKAEFGLSVHEAAVLQTKSEILEAVEGIEWWRVYCKWCPNDCQELTDEERKGCLAAGGFHDEAIQTVKKAIEGVE